MKRMLLFFIPCVLAAQRDPFTFPDGAHHFVCGSIGLLNSRPCCATISIDGYQACIRAGETFHGYFVCKICCDGVALIDRKKVLLYIKKDPSTWES